jgi:hypothetical protein
MRKGAMTQFTNTLKAICTHIARWRKTWWSVSNLILHMMGYIITRSPTAIAPISPPSLLPSTSLPSLPPNSTPEKDGHTNRNTNAHKLPLLQRRPRAGHEVPQDDADGHSEEDP